MFVNATTLLKINKLSRVKIKNISYCYAAVDKKVSIVEKSIKAYNL